MIRSALIISLVGLVTGCAGSMHGVFRESGEQVSVSRYAGLCLDSLLVTLPDGETFIGYVTVPENERETDPFCVSRYPNAPASSSVVSDGHASEDILFSDRLNMMRCELRFQKPGRWDAASGIGVCRLSDSRIIDVQ